jgi:site-specific DNA-methyltransferase (adenine-specific)
MDCLEGMKNIPDKIIDLIVTDPPYGLNYNNGDMASLWEAIFNGDKSRMVPRPIANDDEETAMKLFEDFLKTAKRILKKGACCCCCCGGGGGPKPLFAKWTLLMDKYIGFKQAIVWDKGGLGMGLHYRRNYEFILIAQNGDPAHRWNGGNTTPNVWRIPKIIPSEREHPTVKPVDLMRKIILLHSNEGDIVLDPFAGSGTTCVAAQIEKRNYIAFEIDHLFMEMASKRIENHKRQLKLF